MYARTPGCSGTTLTPQHNPTAAAQLPVAAATFRSERCSTTQIGVITEPSPADCAMSRMASGAATPHRSRNRALAFAVATLAAIHRGRSRATRRQALAIDHEGWWKHPLFGMSARAGSESSGGGSNADDPDLYCRRR